MQEAPTPGGSVFWNNKVNTQLSELITSAKRHLILVSPYVRLDEVRNVARDIQAALDRRVQVRLVVRSKDASTREHVTNSTELKGLRARGLKLLEVNDLHAKVYFSEKAALVTSMNLLQSSMNNSIEIGMQFDALSREYKQIDEFLRTFLRSEIREISEQDEDRRRLPKKIKTRAGRRSKRREIVLTDDEGFCIRCADDVELDSAKPYCIDCYRTWQKRDDGDQWAVENYCHDCGDKAQTCFAKPLCRTCYELQVA